MVLNQKYLQVDETPIKVLDRDHKNGIHQGYMWLYHAPVDRLVLFDYRRGRDQSGPKEMPADFKGIIQTDGYKVYDALFENHPDIHLTFCMAHARRYFVFQKEGKKGVILEGHLKEERSSWNIKIFENNNYRVRRSGLGGFKDHEGKYLLKNDTLKIESIDCNQCRFNNEWIVGEKKLVLPLS